MSHNKFYCAFVLFLIVGFFYNCSNQSSSTGRVSVKVVDDNGDLLPVYGVQTIDVNDAWLGVPQATFEANNEAPIQVDLPNSQSVILKFIAPGYQPKYTFLNQGFRSTEFEVSLESPVVLDEPRPVVIGNFNDYDPRSGIEMKKDAKGTWSAEINTDLDTVRYVIKDYSLLTLPGTVGEPVIKEDAPGFDHSYVAEQVRNNDDQRLTVSFDPADYSLNKTSSTLSISSVTDESISGVSEVYTRMIEEYMNQLFANIQHQRKNKDGRYAHDYSSYLADLDSLKTAYINPKVFSATILAKLRFSRELDIAKSEASALLDSLAPDSPLWMMHPSALSTAVRLAGLNNYTNALSNIAEDSPYPTLRGEALYNLVRYHHKQENKEQWHKNFFELVSNYPDHYRTLYAYENYAPEQPVAEGKALPYNQFTTLDGKSTIDLNELDESYLLLDFWATWCGPCIEAMPELHQAYEQFSGSEFAIVSVSLDDKAERVNSFRNEWEMPWYHAHEKQSGKKIREMGIVGIPRYMLLGPDRKVISYNQSALRDDQLITTLKKYIE